jgi:hypothetical protein
MHGDEHAGAHGTMRLDGLLGAEVHVGPEHVVRTDQAGEGRLLPLVEFMDALRRRPPSIPVGPPRRAAR